MSLLIAAIADVHAGPRALFAGKLRKLSEQGLPLLDHFVRQMNQSVHPDIVAVLGDLIEDETAELDRVRYAECASKLRTVNASVQWVLGNHDILRQSPDDAVRAWGDACIAPYGSTDCGRVHVVRLWTHERTNVEVAIDDEQVMWLERDLDGTQLPTVVLMHHSAAEQDLTGNRWFQGAPQLALIKGRQSLRSVIARTGKVKLVLNGHLHWNHVAVHDGIPYVTVQSLTENVDDDAPGRPSSAYGLITLDTGAINVTINGLQPLRFQHFNTVAPQ